MSRRTDFGKGKAALPRSREPETAFATKGLAGARPSILLATGRLGCLALVLFTSVAHAADLETAAFAPGVRLDEIQVIGTHNSYHLEPSAAAKTWRTSELIRRELPALAALAVEYSHVSLTEQLERLGVRQLELDLHLPPQPGGEFLVRHLPVFDDCSNTPTLSAALREIRAWSRAHPRHVPVFVQLELKMARALPFPLEQIEDRELRAQLAALPPPRAWSEEDFSALEATIRAVFSVDELITPDSVRSDAPTLRDAIRGRGWPLLDAVRGRVLFTLDNEGELRDRYLGSAVDGHGRLLFVSVPPEHSAAAWMKLNDPVRDFACIQELVRAGFIVRTRADEELREAKAHATTHGDSALRHGDVISPLRSDRALASGAQIVSTDFPASDPRHGTYVVRLPGGVVARPSPLAPQSNP